MNFFWLKTVEWWSGGELLMPVMLTTAFALYTCVGERLWVLYGPASHLGRRADELQGLIEADHAQDRDLTWRQWVARYVAAAEEAELTRGFLLIRVLTLCLPLLGLLGTVTGMVDTFGSLAVERSGASGSAQQASAGIGLALTATQYGMALAIPAVVAEWLLRRRVEDLVHHREVTASGLIAGGRNP